MLSRSNLVKQVFMIPPQSDEKRIIDSNPLVKKRLGEFARQSAADGDGFVSGLAAEVIDVEEGSGNVIKAEDAAELLERAKDEAQAILREAQAEAVRIRETALAEAEKEKSKVLEQARQQGYVDGTSRAQAQVDALEQEYREKERQIEEAYQQQIDILEPQFIDTITGIYEHIFHVELESYREILVHLISTTMRKLEGSHDFMIHVSREDYPYVSMQKKQMLTGAVSESCNVDVVEDLSVEKNHCMIETENGIYDCGVDTQLSELKRRLQLLSWSKEQQ